MAETLFCADSAAVAGMLSLRKVKILALEPSLLAAPGIDDLRAGPRLSPLQRLQWCYQCVSPRKASGLISCQESVQLCSLPGASAYVQTQEGGEQPRTILAARRARLAVVALHPAELETRTG